MNRWYQIACLLLPRVVSCIVGVPYVISPECKGRKSQLVLLRVSESNPMFVHREKQCLDPKPDISLQVSTQTTKRGFRFPGVALWILLLIIPHAIHQMVLFLSRDNHQNEGERRNFPFELASCHRFTNDCSVASVVESFFEYDEMLAKLSFGALICVRDSEG